MNIVDMALWLESRGIGRWSPGSPFGPDEVGIFLRFVPDRPKSVITLTPYNVSDTPALNTGLLGVQVRTRAAGQDPRATENLADRIFRELHGQRYPWAGATHAYRASGVSLGQDPKTLMWSRSDNYYINTY